MGRPATGSQITIGSCGTTGTGKYAYQVCDPGATTGCAIQSATYTETRAEDNITAFGDTSLQHSNLRGSWQIDFTGRMPRTTRKMGNTSLITVSSGTAWVSRAESFRLSLDWGEIETTPLDPVDGDTLQNDWMLYIPKRLVKVSGSWTGVRDQSLTEADTFKQGDTAPVLLFRITDETTDNSFSFSTVTIGRTWTGSAPEDGKQTYGYDFVATGAITVAGSTNLFASGTLGVQAMDDSDGLPSETLVISATSGTNSYTGMCFLKSVSMDCPANGPISVSGVLRGTGVMASAD